MTPSGGDEPKAGIGGPDVDDGGRRLNPQYNLARPDGLAVRIATHARRRMFNVFMEEFSPTAHDEVLDLGVTSDASYASSNYLEAWYPYRDRIVAAGIDAQAIVVEERYPGVRFQHADACDLPFADDAFDLVHSAAVIEHVGSRARQARMIAECTRVARRGLCITTPNRWYPVELHTQLPFMHWLPPTAYRRVLAAIGQKELALEENLNLLTARALLASCPAGADWRFRVARYRLLGPTSNLILIGVRTSVAARGSSR